jgi:hypothetical protein
MNAKRNVVIVFAVVLVMLLSTAAWNAVIGNGGDHEKGIHWGDDLAWSPAGVWVLSVPTPMGDILMLHNNHAQDLAGTRFGGTVVHVNDNPTHFGMFPDVDGGKGWVSQTVRTGPDTFATTMLEYGTKSRENAPHELATIGISTSTWRITGPDTKEGQATYAVYLANQDADGDGFPDEGEEPVACTPFTFTGRRLRVMPDCVPTPMPEPPTQ